MLNLTQSGERDVRGVLRAIGLDSNEDTPERDSLWRSAWIAIACLRMRWVIDRRRVCAKMTKATEADEERSA